MSAFGSKADMTVCGSPLSRSLLGVKRTCFCTLHMSAYDPKRTSTATSKLPAQASIMSFLEPRGRGNEAARVHHIVRRRDGSRVAVLGARATLCIACYWAHSQWIGFAEHPHNNGISRWSR